MLRKIFLVAALPAVMALVVTFTKSGPRAVAPQVPAPALAEEHEHRPAAHGGQIVAVGRNNYHAEAVVEQGGRLRLYTLGADEARVQEVERQSPQAFVKLEDAADAVKVILHPEPQPGDAGDKTSCFVGELPAALRGRALTVTIPSLAIGGERFRLHFSLESAAHAEAALPVKVRNDEEIQLYLTPGGKYTAADIAANGSVTASAKFDGIQAAHDLKPRPGDAICPVTLTKASPKFTWVVGGQSYQFCCPPCVDEFVQTAKDHPQEIQAPGAYQKK